MRTFKCLLVAAVAIPAVAGPAFAQSGKSATSPATTPAAASKSLAGELVAVDHAAKTVTVKHIVDKKPVQITFSVEESAVATLAQFKPGDQMMSTLPNGLTYIICPHRNPEGRVSIWLHVASGSLNETDSTRGLAHYLEHMAFNGSANFAPGSVVPFFQSLGLAFGRDQNAFTSFDQTTYQLTLPGGGRDVVEKGLLFMSDVAMRMSLGATEIDGERQIILEEKRARASAQQRVQDQVYERLAPESTLGRRLPIGVEQTITSVTRPDFQDYYSRWYVPSNMTVIVVGDTDPAMVAEVIQQQFGGGRAVPRPTPRDAGVKAS